MIATKGGRKEEGEGHKSHNSDLTGVESILNLCELCKQMSKFYIDDIETAEKHSLFMFSENMIGQAKGFEKQIMMNETNLSNIY